MTFFFVTLFFLSRKMKENYKEIKKNRRSIIIVNKPVGKTLKGYSGGVYIQYAMKYSQKHTPPHCFFCNLAGWEDVWGYTCERTW